jgi:hypothetical protein
MPPGKFAARLLGSQGFSPPRAEKRGFDVILSGVSRVFGLARSAGRERAPGSTVSRAREISRRRTSLGCTPKKRS